MSRRLARVEELLRRELSDVIVRGTLRDPRLRKSSAITITGVSVSADLGSAHVFIDVLSEEVDPDQVIAGLRAGASAIRARLADKIHLKRVPTLHFDRDASIARAARIEQILAEVRPEGEDDDDDGEFGDPEHPDDGEP